MKNFIFASLGIVFLLEAIYFNIVFDLLLIMLLFSTSLSLGSYFKTKIFGIDKVLISLAIGLGSLGFLLWLSTFYNYNYKSLYIIFSVLVIFLRRAYLFKYFTNIRAFLKRSYNIHNVLIFIIAISFMFYIIASSAPIHEYDALTKHIAIPFQMLNRTNWDYNVIESIVFGDYALLSYTLYLYLLALGGVKALVILNTLLSFLLLIVILRISSFLYKDRIYFILITLLYISVPLIYSQSTILYIDIIPLYFVFNAYLLVQYSSLRNIRTNIIMIGLIAGFAMFSKQTAFFYIVPLIFYILYLGFKYRKQLALRDTLILLKAILFALITFLPSILIIWYKTGNPLFPFMNATFKSQYFPITDFVDPFHKSVLGIDFHSLYSIVFETSKNVEMMPFGAGVYILLAPLIFLGLFLKNKRRKYFFLFLVTLGSYWMSTKFSYNIRYFLGSLILLIPTFLYVLLTFSQKLKYSKYIITLAIVAISVIQVGIILHPGNYLGFKKSLLKPNNNLITLENSSILDKIPNKEKQFVLSNNDPFRGIFEGHFYALNWHNSYLLNILNSNKLSPADFLRQFNYYLIDKRLPLSMYTRKLDPQNIDIKGLLQKYLETDSHILYKVKKDMTLLKEEMFTNGIIVSVNKPQVKVIENNSSSYRIILDIEKINSDESMGRYQINWLDNNDKFISTSLVPFIIKKGRNIYTSQVIQNIPKNAKKGIFYLTSHDKIPIKIYSYKIFSTVNGKFLRNILDKYNEKFPHLSKD